MSVKQPRTRKFMAHEPGFTIIDAMNRLFPAWFDGESCWDAWRVILKPQNPARWRGHLDHLLPKQSKLARGHHAAMPYEHVAAFVGRLRENDSLTAQALASEVHGSCLHQAGRGDILRTCMTSGRIFSTGLAGRSYFGTEVLLCQ